MTTTKQGQSPTQVPIGRRVAQWRMRRRMTQQVFADRIGKSKSWVDKVERGIRKLDKFSVIQHIAEVLHIDPAALLDGQEISPVGGSAIGNLEKLQAALTCHATFNAQTKAPHLPKLEEIQRQIEYAWLTYGHGDYPQLLRILPNLLSASQQLHALRPQMGTEPLVQAYKLASSVLVKLEEAHLAWIAADRAVIAAGNDRTLAATAALSLTQALRALDENRLALATALAAAHHIAQLPDDTESAEQTSLLGALLLQAALAAASNNDPPTVKELLLQAANLSRQEKDQDMKQQHGFSQIAVELAQIVTRARLGETRQALAQHEMVIESGRWLHLPAEHRSAYLLNITRMYMEVGNPQAAGRTVTEAHRIAPAEVQCASDARALVAEIFRCGSESPDVSRLAIAFGLTR
ncbi:helix-turn-helix domain-containing protein [Solwaraspora sp. WMMA2080]|uniref:helix-turn-helix domain-containing protein n=1 Tax=unclassified Solwaraspora TaxID=2627926 RepID=UPI00248CD52D|nr:MULTISPECIES: helix-turn-helix domain-containing protein [unclassified Solwaraspora]WBB97275.1 helix-turn-helix domain-containing protein [Solwaraspora sp. WMMA2059]WBC18825.1 helix-turn-helix domain-containing protein [Solwaraspora sp. WMMA2080]